jgi:competence protein ComEC
VNFFAWLPLASFSVPPPNLIEVATLYAVLGALLVARRRVHLYWAAPIVGALLIQDGFYWRAEGLGKKELRVTFLSVGQGDAVVVELPDSQVLVIDAGGSAAGEFDPGASIVAPFLHSRRINRVHYVLVSYPRVDHYGGMKSIVERFKPSEFWSGPSAGNTSRYADLEEAVDRLKVSRAVLGTHLGCRSIGEVRLCVLHPPEAGSAKKRSGRGESVVVRLTFGEHHFLFTGDIDGRAETLLVESGQDLASHVLKIPSHGSGNASTESFVAAVRPGLAIVSAGHRNPYGFPREEVLQRYESAGARILRTDEDGAVTITSDGRNLRYQTHRSGKSGRIG